MYKVLAAWRHYKNCNLVFRAAFCEADRPGFASGFFIMLHRSQAQVSEENARITGLGGALCLCKPIEHEPLVPRATASKNCRKSLTDLVGGACKSCNDAARRGVVCDTVTALVNCSVLRAKLPPLCDKDSNNALRSRTGTYWATATWAFGEQDLARLSSDEVLRLAASIMKRPRSAPPAVPSQCFR